MKSSRSIRPGAALGTLVFLHFLVDFYGGLPVPLLEPTLTNHLGMSIGRVSLLIGGWALLMNIVQPASAWLLPERGVPALLWMCPFAAAVIALMSLSGNPHFFIVLLIVSGLGIGLLHPEGVLAAHSLGGRRSGLGVGMFMSAGYLGFASGGAVAGLWVEILGQDLRYFWLLLIPAFAAGGLVLWSGLHRLQGHVAPEPRDRQDQGRGPFFPVFLLAVGVAGSMCLLVRFITVLLVRRFPDMAAQGWGGMTVFATGITGALGALLWSHLSDRYGPAPILAVVHLLAMPFLALLLGVNHPGHAPLWGLGLGFTLGSALPLVVIQARRARGLTQRLRMGLAIGGAWLVGETVFILAGLYLDGFDPTDAEAVVRVLGLCWIPLVSNTLLAAWLSRIRSRKRERLPPEPRDAKVLPP